MKGFSVEPGERSVLVMSIQPERLASKKSAEPTSPRISPVMASASTIATDTRGPSFCAASRATASSPSCTLLLDRQLVARLGRLRCAAPCRRRGRRAPAGRARWPDTSSSAARAASRSPSRPAVDHAGEHAVARGLRGFEVAVGPAASRAIAAGRRAVRLPKPSAASAPCRNRRARRRARLRDCRHRARASGSAPGSRAWRAAARSAWRERSGGASCRCCGFRAARSAGQAASKASSRPRRCGRCRRTVLRRAAAPADRRR